MNLIQLVGWTAFEFWAMSRVANAVSRDLFGLDAPLLWLVVVAVVCTALAPAGRSCVVRRWLERFGIWVVAAVALWITFRVLTVGDLGRSGTAGDRRPAVLAGRRPGDRDAGVVAAARRGLQPVRPRRTRRRPPARSGATQRATSGSTRWARCWCSRPGRRAGRAGHRHDDRRHRRAAGSCCWRSWSGRATRRWRTSTRARSRCRTSGRTCRSAVDRGGGRRGARHRGRALATRAGTFEVFLFLIGSVFVPLFGVFVADYFVLSRGRYGEAAMFERAEPSRSAGGLVAVGRRVRRLPVVRADGTGVVDRRGGAHRARLAPPAVPADRGLTARGEHPELRGGVRSALLMLARGRSVTCGLARERRRRRRRGDHQHDGRVRRTRS